MIVKGKTSDWPPVALNIVYRNLNHLPCRVYIGQSTQSKCTLDKNQFFKNDIILIFSSFIHKFIVWNVKIHEGLHAGQTVTLSVNEHSTRKVSSNEISPLFHPLNGTNRAEARNETVIIVPEQRLYDFISSIETYLINGFEVDHLVSTQLYKVERVFDSIIRPRRDPEFRNKILSRYHQTCVVCGEKEPAVLEAAHIVAVKDGGNDNADNGVCLCSNHHKMYDAGIIDIDLEKGVCSLQDGYSQDVAWYKELREREFRLII